MLLSRASTSRNLQLCDSFTARKAMIPYFTVPQFSRKQGIIGCENYERDSECFVAEKGKENTFCIVEGVDVFDIGSPLVELFAKYDTEKESPQPFSSTNTVLHTNYYVLPTTVMIEITTLSERTTAEATKSTDST
ncbi:hypothetical protein L873DRAFT_1788245 [Choiromyces venosus 120613-1]|uniref:Uncharacterized protein n=1 Tax=Choiromyces venosus 120613-1 TaxID=1336337 RepID=A0A3N4JX59_9PEZI|nr:hypothetical protein L873DRAFT_1788245 [Choiromyces venosus 120613-1]